MFPVNNSPLAKISEYVGIHTVHNVASTPS